MAILRRGINYANPQGFPVAPTSSNFGPSLCLPLGADAAVDRLCLADVSKQRGGLKDYFCFSSASAVCR
jgi:hypothetical protein